MLSRHPLEGSDAHHKKALFTAGAGARLRDAVLLREIGNTRPRRSTVSADGVRARVASLDLKRDRAL